MIIVGKNAGEKKESAGERRKKTGLRRRSGLRTGISYCKEKAAFLLMASSSTICVFHTTLSATLQGAVVGKSQRVRIRQKLHPRQNTTKSIFQLCSLCTNQTRQWEPDLAVLCCLQCWLDACSVVPA